MAYSLRREKRRGSGGTAERLWRAWGAHSAPLNPRRSGAEATAVRRYIGGEAAAAPPSCGSGCIILRQRLHHPAAAAAASCGSGSTILRQRLTDGQPLMWPRHGNPLPSTAPAKRTRPTAAKPPQTLSACAPVATSLPAVVVRRVSSYNQQSTIIHRSCVHHPSFVRPSLRGGGRRPAAGRALS